MGNTVLTMMPTRVAPDVSAWDMAALAACKYGSPICIQRGEPRDFNRNRCVQIFLDNEAKHDWLFFVDDDTIIPEFAIERLLAVGKPIVTGIQPLYLMGCLVANVKLKDGEGGISAPWPAWVTWKRPSEPFEIGFCGFGCILIHRSVFESIGYPWFVESYGDVWGAGNRTEDIDFCLKAQAKGFEIWCDPSVECGHLKRVDLREWLLRKEINLTITRQTTAGE